MKKFKKILSLTLALALCLSVAVPAIAIDNEKDMQLYVYSKDCPAEFISFAKDHVGDFLLTSGYPDSGQIYLGVPFSFANAASNIFYFPIFDQNQIISLLRVFDSDNGDISGVLSPFLVEQLNSYAGLTTRTNPLRIVSSDKDIIFELDGQQEIVFSYPESFDEDEATPMSISDDLFSVVRCEPKSEVIIPDDISPYATVPNSKYLNLFPNVSNASTQSGNNWCTAYVAAAIMTYKGVSLSAYDVMRGIYGNPKPENSLSDAQVVLVANSYGFTPIEYGYTLSAQKLYEQIAADMPVYIGMYRTTSDGKVVGHAVALCGYNQTTAMYRIWNPWYNYYETIYSLFNYTPSEDSSKTYDYRDTIYNWQS